MKQWLVILLGSFIGMGMVIEAAEAKRLGGGRSVGQQRQIAPQPGKGAQQEAQRSPAAAPGPNAAPRSGMSRWLAPMAGIAAALGLAYLFGDQLGSLLVLLLIVAAVVVVLRLLTRGLSARKTAPAGGPAQYGGLGQETEIAPPRSQFVTDQPASVPHFAQSIPADLDVDAFVAQAKRNFLALQAANDRGDLDALREMLSDDLYVSIEQEIHERGDAAQQTDVVTLDAQLLEVGTEQGTHWASIRFSGLLREEVSDTATRFEEIWNLRKPQSGRTGWMLAGIQQVA
jgi:predicted lipid-binding transport protein (Tim44 family)